ncbi:MAG: 4Fe-4S dicluster domain-containing protein [Eubacteriaceae bacterium]|nr:4Fe-4S dicluster domain-containing protein [Eubacteriaceae bacterium]
MPQEGHDFLAKQTRIVLRNAGSINPEEIDEYIAVSGYSALKKCLSGYSSEDVISQMEISGLAGRGGAGFPTWFKWKAARDAPGRQKYLICNADEGDPGAFMDRAILEGDPHAVIEGMVIAAYAIGASIGIVYCRAEYPLAIKRLKKAISDAYAGGFLGSSIYGTEFSFDLEIKEGAGAFVCGEETALIASLEGERGMPRQRPPYPAASGLWQLPTNINNVETFANVPWIINNGARAFAKHGLQTSRGTKVFALTGKIKNSGLVEVPMGMTIHDLVFNIGDGGAGVKAVQMGGPSGGCIPRELFDTPIDYKSLQQTGAIMGSGGMVVMDESTCMVDIARFFLEFTCNESCGKCVHCRIGTKRMLEILERIVAGEGQMEDLGLLESLATQVKEGSLCELGKSAPNPVLTTIRYFRDEYEAHIEDKKCPAKHCRALVSYSIDPGACTGCSVCKTGCPVNAISGEPQETHKIDSSACTRCSNCLRVCNFGAVLAN